MIKNIKYLKLVKKVISVPPNFSTLREHGNVLKDGSRFIFTSTATRIVNGKREYSTHYWIAANKRDWVYQGKLNLPFQSEDLHLSKEGNKFVAMYENKSSELLDRFIISYATADSLDGVFAHYPSLGYTPKMTGIPNCYAVYSPLRINNQYDFIDGRWDNSELNIEQIGLVKNKGKFKTIMYPTDYGYDTLGVGGSVHKIGNEYVLELAGGIDWTPPPHKYIKWVNGLVLLDSNFNVIRMLNKVLKDQAGNAVWATFFKDNGDWFALSRKKGTNDIYLAEIVNSAPIEPKPPIEPPNGGSMKPTNLRFENNELSSDIVTNATRYDAYASGGFQLDLISSAYTVVDGRVVFNSIQDKFILDVTQDYWITAKVAGVSYKSDKITISRDDEPIDPPIEPPTHDHTKALNHIRAARAELNKAEEELMK